jgi:hypothetical protein
MSAGPYTRAAQRGCGGAILQLVLVVASVAFLFGVPGLVAVVLPASVDPTLRLAIVGGSLVVGLLLFVVGAFGFAMRRTGVLDAGFAPFGVPGRSFIPNLREYHGAAHGRELDATYTRRGGVLDVALAARSGTKITIGRGAATRRARELLGLSTMPPSSDPALAGLVIAADEPAWAERWLADPAVRATLQALLHDPAGREIRWVFVRPDVVKVVRRWIDPDRTAATIPDMVSVLAGLAESVERQGPPTRLVATNALETSFRRSPTLAAFALVGVILVVIVVPMACIAGIALVTGLR